MELLELFRKIQLSLAVVVVSADIQKLNYNPIPWQQVYFEFVKLGWLVGHTTQKSPLGRWQSF